MLEYPLLLVFPVAMAFAAAFDLFTMTIPNKVSMALVASFMVVAPLSGMPWPEIGVHIVTGAAILLVGFGCFVRGWVGGGDAKLLAASVLWLGFDSLPQFLLTVGVLGGVLSITILMFRRIPDCFLKGPAWMVRLHDKNSGVPYGLAIAGAAMLMYPETRWFTALFA